MRRPILLTAVLFLLSGLVGEACTSFAVSGDSGTVLSSVLEGSFDKGLLFLNARGVRKRGLEPSTTGRGAEWVSLYGSVTFSLAGYQMAWAGMNEAGLAISTMQHTDNPACSEAEDERPPLDAGQWLQYVLDTCGSIADIQAVPQFVRLGGNVDHFLAADRAGRSAVIEIIGGEIIIHAGDDLPVTALTNLTYERALEFWDEFGAYEAVDGTDAWTRTLFERFRMAARFAENWVERDLTIDPVDYVFGVQDYMGRVRWGIAFDLGEMRVWFRTHDNDSPRLVDFDRIDLTCPSDGYTHDVTGDASGDISTQFDPYSRDRSVAQLLHVSHRDEDPAFAYDLHGLFEFFESFSCQ